jgi:hypothetical protein
LNLPTTVEPPKRVGCYVRLAVCVSLVLAAGGHGDDRIERRRAQLLEEMRDLAGQTRVAYAESGREPTLRPHPVFRYDDQPRRFIDATVWVWTDAGRPFALQKIEAKYHIATGAPQWGYCFTSLSPERVTVQWPEGRTYQSTEPGAVFRELPEAPPVPKKAVARRRQLRELARRFSARIVMDAKKDETQAMRLLPTPLLEYADPGSDSHGAVFGFAATGTNPDLVVLIEVGRETGDAHYRFAPARMTSGGLHLQYDGVEVWDVPWVNWDQAPFAAWTFFAAPRTPVPDESIP